jgi:hypothetical protein
VSLQNEGSANIPASGLLIDCSPVITCVISRALPPPDTPQSAWILSSIQQQTQTIGSLYVTDRVGCDFTQQFNSIVTEGAEYLPKRPLSPTVLMVKHDKNNPPQPFRPLFSHNYRVWW